MPHIWDWSFCCWIDRSRAINPNYWGTAKRCISWSIYRLSEKNMTLSNLYLYSHSNWIPCRLGCETCAKSSIFVKRSAFEMNQNTPGMQKPLFWDLCKTPLLPNFCVRKKILILKILNVFLWLKFSPSLNLNPAIAGSIFQRSRLKTFQKIRM